MLVISVTLDVSKLLRPVMLVSTVQLRNIRPIFVVLDVLKLLTSKLVSALQPLNIERSVVALSVFRMLTSRVVSLEQELNMDSISVVLDVSSLLRFSIDVTEEKSSNQCAVLAGLIPLSTKFTDVTEA